MADDFDPLEDIDDRLRRLVRDTEPLVVLDAPAEVRLRGERRRARRRTGALALVTAAVVGLGGWQLVPRFTDMDSSRGGGVPAASSPATPVPGVGTEVLAKELLPPSALPGYDKLRWKAADSAGSPSLLPTDCRFALPLTLLAAQAGQAYTAVNREVAYYHLFEFRDTAAAANGAVVLNDQIRGDCLGSNGAEPKASSVVDDTTQYWGGREHHAVTVLLEVKGRYAAVLLTSDADGIREDAVKSFGTFPYPYLCISRSLSLLGSVTGDGSAPSAPGRDGIDKGFAPDKKASTAGGSSGAADSPKDPSAPFQHC